MTLDQIAAVLAERAHALDQEWQDLIDRMDGIALRRRRMMTAADIAETLRAELLDLGITELPEPGNDPESSPVVISVPSPATVDAHANPGLADVLVTKEMEPAPDTAEPEESGGAELTATQSPESSATTAKHAPAGFHVIDSNTLVTLLRAGTTKVEAAEILGVKVKTLEKHLARYGGATMALYRHVNGGFFPQPHEARLVDPLGSSAPETVKCPECNGAVHRMGVAAHVRHCWPPDVRARDRKAPPEPTPIEHDVETEPAIEESAPRSAAPANGTHVKEHAEVGTSIRKLLDNADNCAWTREELVAAADIRPERLAKLERGEPPTDKEAQRVYAIDKRLSPAAKRQAAAAIERRRLEGM